MRLWGAVIHLVSLSEAANVSFIFAPAISIDMLADRKIM